MDRPGGWRHSFAQGGLQYPKTPHFRWNPLALLGFGFGAFPISPDTKTLGGLLNPGGCGALSGVLEYAKHHHPPKPKSLKTLSITTFSLSLRVLRGGFWCLAYIPPRARGDRYPASHDQQQRERLLIGDEAKDPQAEISSQRHSMPLWHWSCFSTGRATLTRYAGIA